MALAMHIDLEEERAARRPLVAEWLLAMGEVVHRLDYGGRVLVLGCGDPWTTALLSAAYPLAGVDAVDEDPGQAAAAHRAVVRLGAAARCEVEVASPGAVAPGAYDLVCLGDGLAAHADPVGWARAALRAVRPTGAVMVVEHRRVDSFLDGPVTVGAWLLRAGAARVRLASASPTGFVLDARPVH